MACIIKFGTVTKDFWGVTTISGWHIDGRIGEEHLRFDEMANLFLRRSEMNLWYPMNGYREGD